MAHYATSSGTLFVVQQAINQAFGYIRVLSVRRQGFWDQGRPKLRERLAHLVGLIMQRVACDASVAFRASFV